MLRFNKTMVHSLNLECLNNFYPFETIKYFRLYLRLNKIVKEVYLKGYIPGWPLEPYA